MRVRYLNNDGGGFADYVEVAEGTTVSAFFAKHLPSRNPADFLIRVNRQPATADQVLQEGDRVSFTPTKIEGAAVNTPASPAAVRKPKFRPKRSQRRNR